MLRSVMPCTKGGLVVTGLCATCVAVGVVLVGGHGIGVARDQAGNYLCRVVPSSLLQHHEDGSSYLQVDMAGARPCDSTEIAEVNRTQEWKRGSGDAPPRWVPYGHAYAMTGDTDLVQWARRYEFFCASWPTWCAPKLPEPSWWSRFGSRIFP